MNIEKLLKTIKKEVKARDRGEWVSNIGKRRWFPKEFSKSYVDIDNIELIREMYKEVYMTSLEEAIKIAVLLKPKQSEIPVYNLAKYYESLDKFIFGTDQREGVYSGLLRKLAEEGFISEADIVDVIVSSERLFLEGYKVTKKKGKYYLLKPDMSIYLELSSVETNIVKDEFYYDALETVLSNTKDEQEKSIAKFLLSPPTKNVKSFLRPPSPDYANLVGFSDFLKRHPDIKIISYDIRDSWSKLLLKEGQRKKIVAISYRGKKKENYFELLLDVLENSIFNWFWEEYGFMFVKPYPHVYITGFDGYPVAKMMLINNRLIEDMLDYYPLPSEVFVSELTTSMSGDYKKQLKRELADYVLVKFTLGKSKIFAEEQKIEPVMRLVLNFEHKGNKIFGNREYKLNGRPETKDGSHLYLSKDDVIEFAKYFVENGELPAQKAKFLGAKRIAMKNVEEDFEYRLDSTNIEEIPDKLFNNAVVYKLVGRSIHEGKSEIYDNPFSRMIDASGIPTYDYGAMVMKNRAAFFALVAKFLSD